MWQLELHPKTAFLINCDKKMGLISILCQSVNKYPIVILGLTILRYWNVPKFNEETHRASILALIQKKII